MLGYHNKPEETAYALRDGYVYTGDSGYVDRNDRKKGMLIVAGYNVYPREIDEVPFNHTEQDRPDPAERNGGDRLGVK